MLNYSKFRTLFHLKSCINRFLVVSETRLQVSSTYVLLVRDYTKMVSTNVKPVHYDLTLKPNLKDFTFDGKIKTNIQVLEETKEIILNALKLKITSISVQIKNGKEISPKDIKMSEDDETASFIFEEPLSKGDGLMEIEFSGELNDKMKGFYRSKYFVDGEEEPRYAAVTQFEATDARRCFPGWDAPDFKATYDITLIVPKDRIALSNMPVISEFEQDGNLRVVKFDRSPIMSSYLLAIVVGEFDYVEGKSEDGVLVRVYTPLKKENQGSFALDVAIKVLPYYKDYFNIGFPLPKLDLIAIPDLAAGAMENWGLITYRETLLLVDPGNTSLLKKQHIALTVGHEIAHQWFGNLVTMKWWTHLWLNEGYASFSEFLCTHYLFPDFDIWTQFVTDMYTHALDLDSLKSSHPIEVEVKHPSEIDEIFDEISYNKGACIIRMLHNYIGDDDFRKGMHLYLKRHQYGNTETEDLWKAFAESAEKPVTEVMTNWVKEVGYPVVTVLKSVQDGKKRVLTLKQHRFLADGSEDEQKTLWMIPICIATPKNPKAVQCIFEKETMEITVEDVSADDWIKINPGAVGFYRTHYLPEMLECFVKQDAIQKKILPPLDRLGLLDDMFALNQAGKVSTVEVLKLIDAYRNEDNFTVWQAISNNLHNIRIVLSHGNSMEAFDKFCVKLYTPIANKLGWDKKKEESHLDTLLRPLVLSRLITAGCEKTIEQAKTKFEKEGTSVDADLRQLVYKAVLQEGDESVFDKMIQLYRDAESQEEKDRFGLAFGAVQNPAIIQKVLDFSISSEPRSTETLRIVSSTAINVKGRDITWKFFKDNAKVFNEKYDGGSLLSWVVKNLTENFASEEMAKEIEKFFEDNEFTGTERTIQQSVETIRLNELLLKRDSAGIEAFLKAN